MISLIANKTWVYEEIQWQLLAMGTKQNIWENIAANLMTTITSLNLENLISKVTVKVLPQNYPLGH